MKLNQLFLFSLVLFVSQANATTYYVSTSGSTSSSSCSSASPCRTIMQAYAKTKPGDTVIVKAGVYTHYTPKAGNLFNRSGTSALPIVVKSETLRGAVIDLQNKTDANFGVWMSGSYNTIQGFRIRNGYGGGIEVGGNYNKIIDNEISYNGTKGPMSSPYGQDGISGAGSYLTIDRN